MILAQASLPPAQDVRAGGGQAQPSNSVRSESPSSGAGDRGYRQAERVLAAVSDIGSTHSRYLGRVAEEGRYMWANSLSVTCRRGDPCTYLRYFDISRSGKTKVALLFNLRLSERTETICGDLRADKTCAISASVRIAGDEAFPHCVGVGPIRRAATRRGWKPYPYRHPPYDQNVSRYRHDDDKDLYLFIRTLKDSRCFSHIHVARLPAVTAPSR